MYNKSTLWFDWDEEKNRANKLKHGVSFEEAMSAFDDEQGLLKADPDEAGGEERFLLLGMSAKLRVLAVCHCVRESETVFRIISACKAVPKERKAYAEAMH